MAENSSFEKYKNFPENQDTPDIALLNGHENVERLNGKNPQPTEFWKIMNPFGPLIGNHDLKRPYDVSSEIEVTLGDRIKIREEKFGGILYNGGIVAAVNRPGYKILEKLKFSSTRAGEIPNEFVKELTKYGALRTVV